MSAFACFVRSNTSLHMRTWQAMSLHLSFDFDAQSASATTCDIEYSNLHYKLSQQNFRNTFESSSLAANQLARNCGRRHGFRLRFAFDATEHLVLANRHRFVHRVFRFLQRYQTLCRSMAASFLRRHQHLRLVVVEKRRLEPNGSAGFDTDQRAARFAWGGDNRQRFAHRLFGR